MVVVVKAWAAQCNEGVLVGHIDRDTLSLPDILRFVLTFARRHRSSGVVGSARWKPLSAACAGKLDMWRRSLVAWLAKLADKVVLVLYLDSVASRDQVAPAVRFKRPNKRKYTVISVEAKWATLEDARVTRADPVTVLALRSQLAEFGCHPDCADSWMRKEQAMYVNAMCNALSFGASHASYTFS